MLPPLHPTVPDRGAVAMLRRVVRLRGTGHVVTLHDYAVACPKTLLHDTASSLELPRPAVESRSNSAVPAGIPATRQTTFSSGWTPAFAMIWTFRRTRPPSAAGSVRAITGTSAARDTRFGSWKDAETFAGSRNKSYQTGALLSWPAGTSETLIVQFRRHYV
jgi:hypothetical protein